MNPGSRIGSYRVIDLLGTGGMGSVWRAEDSQLGREVALKVLPDSFADDASRHLRFEREAKLLASLNHPNIATLFGLEHLEDRHVLVMELVDGEGLDERIARGPIPVHECVAIACQIAEALEAAHHSGIVHRDLKPANIRIRSDGTVKVLDFGLAKSWEVGAGDSSPSLSPTLTHHATAEGVILGTAAYMAPEQARGKAVDSRADIWAFGVVLWEMLTARRLFQGETVSDILAAVLRAEPDLGALPRGVPKRLRRLIERCLNRDARMRLQCMGDARVALAQIEDGEPDAILPPSVSAGALAAVAALSLLVAVAAVAWSLLRPSPGPPSQLSLEVASAGFKQYSNTAISPDGKWIAYSLSRGGSTIRLRNLDSFDVHEIPGTEDASNPFFSPDGRWLVVFDNARDSLAKVAVKAGTVQRIPGARIAGAFNTGCWHPSGFLVVTSAVIDERSWPGLASVPETGGDPAILTTLEGDETLHASPTAVPDSQWILFDCESTTRTDLWAVSLASGERKLVLADASTAMAPRGDHLLVYRAQQHSVVMYRFNAAKAEIEGEPTVVLSSVGANARDCGRYAVSSSGTLIYNPDDTNSSEGRNTLVWVDRKGQMTEVLPEKNSWRQPRLSTDGRKILIRHVLTPECDLWSYDLERETLTRISFEHDTHDPLWGPSGNTVLYAGDTDPVRRLFEISTDGSGSPRLFAEAPSSLRATSWSADGRRLALSAGGPSNTGDVWILDQGDDSEPHPFLDTRFSERFPSLSPDGSWVAYASDESGRFEVYARPYPGPGGRVQVSVDGGSEPRWTRDGSEILYRGDAAVLVVAVSIDGDRLEIGRPRKLFADTYLRPSPITPETHSYDVSGDGQRLLMIKPAEAEAHDDDLRIVLDWTSHLDLD